MDTFREVERKLCDSDEETRRSGVSDLPSLEVNSDTMRLLVNALGDSNWRVRKDAVESIFDFPSPDLFVGMLIDCLHSDDNAGLRNSAMEGLTKLGSKAIPRLLDSISDKDQDVRKFIVDVLSEIGGDEAVRALASALDDDDENVKISAVEGLGKIGGSGATDVLLDILEDENWSLKFAALESLGSIGEAIPMDGVYKVCKDKVLRRAGYELLGKVGTIEAVPYLIDGLMDGSSINRETAMVALWNLSLSSQQDDFDNSVKEKLTPIVGQKFLERLVSAISSPNPETRKAAIYIARIVGRVDVLQPLLDVVSQDDCQEDVAKALTGMGEQVVPLLIDAYSQRGENVRVLVCYVLGRIDGRGVEDLLLKALEDEYGHVRAAAAESLALISSGKAIGPLFKLLGDEYKDVREASLDALSVLSRYYRVDILQCAVSLLSSNDAIVKSQVLKILSRLGDRAEMKYVRMALKDDSPDVRASAVMALEREGGGAIHDVILCLADEDPNVRLVATNVLGTIGGRGDVCRIAALLKEEIMRDEDIWVKSAAISSLANIGGAEIVDTIREMVEDEEGIIAISAVEALGRTVRRHPEMLDSILPSLSKGLSHGDKEVIKSTLSALGEIAMSRDVVNMVKPFLNHKDWDVRVNVVDLLSKCGEMTRDMLLERYQLEEDYLVKTRLEAAINH